MSSFAIKLYKNGRFLRVLEVQAENRHHAEEIARHVIETTDADAMGTIGQITY